MAASFAGAIALSACSNDTISTDRIEGPVSEDSTADSSKDTSKAEYKTYDVAIAIQRLKFKDETAILYELDESFDLTGREFTEKKETDSTFLFEGIKLRSPYAFIKISGKVQSTYYGDGYTSSVIPFVTIVANLDKQPIMPSQLTTIEGELLIQNLKKGVPYDSALALTRESIQKAYLLKDKVDSKEFADFFECYFNYTGTWHDSTFTKEGEWKNDSVKAMTALRHRELNDMQIKNGCFEKSIDFFGDAFKLGPCGKDNIGEIKKNELPYGAIKNQHLYCSQDSGWLEMPLSYNDTVGWEPGHDGEIRKGDYLKTSYYIYDSLYGGWVDFFDPDTAKGPCVTSNKNEIKSTPQGYYYCNPVRDTTRIVNVWSFIYVIETALKEEKLCNSKNVILTVLPDSGTIQFCDSNATRDTTRELSLLEQERQVTQCGTNDTLVRGSIDTTKWYFCTGGELNNAGELERTIGRICKKGNEGYAQVNYSLYYCNGFSWKLSADSMIVDSFIDARDSSTYMTIGIDSLIWMSHNLRFKTDSSWCYADTTVDCETYGRLYRWEDNIKLKKDICPEGWRLPTVTEWENTAAFGRSWYPKEPDFKIFGSTSGWIQGSLDPHGKDLIGFNAYPAGSRNANGNFSNITESTQFCTAEEDNDGNPTFFMLTRQNKEGFLAKTSRKAMSCSIRCVKE